MESVILCLANSRKLNDRCIAGIDVRTGQWVRPVSRSGEKGAVPFSERQIDSEEPLPLDLIQMELEDNGPTGFDYCHAKENRWIVPAPWRRVGRYKSSQLESYCCTYDSILHGRGKYTRPDVIEAKPIEQRHTLELRRVNQLQLKHDGVKWRCSFVTPPGIASPEIPVTDLELLAQLKRGAEVSRRGFAVVSLSVPLIPPHIPNWDQGEVGWKLLASWIPSE